ncbi:glutaredoxin family protein [Mammaliicoccus lentus]|uniref:glutaredoxin family protein n=1 Tax=Mammaliicoccus lentus TaxID=42858 RepID=UPI001B340C7E|nr:glutaredoxin family protein [Mammaliicoccus lentus]
MNIKFYIGRNCGLCEDAKYQLEFLKETFEKPVNIETIHIEDNDYLLNEYMLRIPIVMYQDKILQEGNIDFVTLLEELEKLS